LNIIVDNREDKKYLMLLKQLFPQHIFEYKKIEEGDYVSEKCMVERKTIGDLYSCIKNGRLRNQLSRGLTHNKKYILFVTGDINKYAAKMRGLKIDFSEKVIYTSIASAMVKYNVTVIWTANEMDGFKILIPMMEKIDKGQAITPTKLNHVVLVAKLFGVSKAISIDLIKKFISLENMVNAPESEFKKIKGIGDVKSKQIKNILRGELNADMYI